MSIFIIGLPLVQSGSAQNLSLDKLSALEKTRIQAFVAYFTPGIRVDGPIGLHQLLSNAHTIFELVESLGAETSLELSGPLLKAGYDLWNSSTYGRPLPSSLPYMTASEMSSRNPML